MIQLFLFENDADAARRAIAQGIGHFLVDWEEGGKAARQKGFDTEIRPGTLDGLRGVAAVAGARAWCRVNAYGERTAREVEDAVAAGAAGIFLPMARSPREVEGFLRVVDGRCRTGILVETVAAFDAAAELARLPFECVYFGLNDFAIDRGGGSIFRAVLDGSVERMREAFADKAFGFGGVTAVEAGSPVPARRLLEEMARLDCGLGFMRRSYRRDVKGRDPAGVLAGIRDYWARCRARDAEAIARDRRELEALLHGLRG